MTFHHVSGQHFSICQPDNVSQENGRNHWALEIAFVWHLAYQRPWIKLCHSPPRLQFMLGSRATQTAHRKSSPPCAQVMRTLTSEPATGLAVLPKKRRAQFRFGRLRPTVLGQPSLKALEVDTARRTTSARSCKTSMRRKGSKMSRHLGFGDGMSH